MKMHGKSGALAFMGLVICAVAGCASQIMQGYVGKDVRQVMLKYGAPANAFDMGDGRRAFQWAMNNDIVMPTHVTTTGTAVGSGNYAWVTSNSTITGGQTISNRCMYTLYGRWDQQSQSWIVSGFEKPSLMCE